MRRFQPQLHKGQPLHAGAVHLYHFLFSDLISHQTELHAILSPAEQSRAARLRFPAPRTRFILARGLLRELLGRYLDVPPAELRFSYNPHGKPTLATPAHAWLHFNLSHSEEMVLLAFTSDRPLGVDVEQIHPVQKMERLVERFFSPAERVAFRALPDGQREAAFFAGWTRKEAYIKGRGLGLALPLHQFDVTLEPQKARLLADRQTPAAVGRWTLRSLDFIPGYAAALAVRGEIAEIVRWADSRIV
ncbi:MAG TPA: 4'-phosphopantetheinyl transferase superfamily protein [Thermoflexia bacterium]|nr:4'-phosphopantetheinyl transferase superfamily protein [Thermoflexia bacterium]